MVTFLYQILTQKNELYIMFHFGFTDAKTPQKNFFCNYLGLGAYAVPYVLSRKNCLIQNYTKICKIAVHPFLHIC